MTSRLSAAPSRAAASLPLLATALLALGATGAAAARPPQLTISSRRPLNLTIDGSAGAPRLALIGPRLTNRGGELVLRATRTHGRVAIVQRVGGTTRRVADVTASRRHPYTLRDGLPDAFSLQLSRRGRVVLRTRMPWCPKLGVGIETPGSCGDPLSTHVTWPLAHGHRLTLAVSTPIARRIAAGRYGAVLRFDPGEHLRTTGVASWSGTAIVTRGGRGRPGSTREPPRQTTPPPSFQDQPADTANLAGAALPNLLPLPAQLLHVVHGKHGDALHFAADVANRGATLVVDAKVGPTDPPGSMDATQVLSGPAGPLLHPAGHVVFDNDDGHNHWHFFNLARYRLVPAGGGATVAQSTKIGFCFSDSDPYDLSVPGAPVAPIRPALHVGSCEHGNPAATSVHMQLDAGWLDLYDQTVAGQAFDVTHVPNGRYAIVIDVNPFGMLAESSTADNTARRVFTLGGRPGARTVRVPPVDGVYTEPID